MTIKWNFSCGGGSERLISISFYNDSVWRNKTLHLNINPSDQFYVVVRSNQATRVYLLVHLDAVLTLNFI